MDCSGICGEIADRKVKWPAAVCGWEDNKYGRKNLYCD